VYILSKAIVDSDEEDSVYGKSISLKTEINIAMATNAIEA
jgi:hypothetical protein